MLTISWNLLQTESTNMTIFLMNFMVVAIAASIAWILVKLSICCRISERIWCWIYGLSFSNSYRIGDLPIESDKWWGEDGNGVRFVPDCNGKPTRYFRWLSFHQTSERETSSTFHSLRSRFSRIGKGYQSWKGLGAEIKKSKLKYRFSLKAENAVLSTRHKNGTR